MLVVSGTTPAIHSRLAWLNNFLPLPVIELSHFLGSVVGLALLILARGLQQRLDVAYHVTILLLTAGILLSLLKGFDYEEALILTVMLSALVPCRSYFYRHASLLSELNLGMAPLSGLEDRTLTPLWNRLGAFVFRHGEHFYNFQGLRQYKEKFAPEWTPRYLASPGGLALPRILANVATLISGGLKGVLTK